MKRLAKRILVGTLSLAMLLTCVTGCGDKKQDDATWEDGKIVVKISMTENTDSLDYARCVKFTEDVNAACDDAFDFQIYANGSLGDFTAVNAECIEGTVEMIYGGLSPSINPLAASTIISYLCITPDDALTAFAKDSFAYNKTLELCEQENLKFLGFDFNGSCGMALRTAAPANPLSVGGGNGLQIRVPSDPVQRAVLTELGYIPASIDWSEVYSSLQSGVIDGFIGATALTAASQFSDVITSYYDINLMTSVNTIVVSNVLWDKLTDDQKAAFELYGGNKLADSIEDYKNATADAYSKLEAAGVNVVVPSDEEMDAIVEIARENWSQLKDSYGEEFYNDLMAAYGLE